MICVLHSNREPQSVIYLIGGVSLHGHGSAIDYLLFVLLISALRGQLMVHPITDY